MTNPEEWMEDDGEALVDLAVPMEEKTRIDHLLDRYDELLSQAEDLSSQIEGLLREWCPAPRPVGNPPPEDRSHEES